MTTLKITVSPGSTVTRVIAIQTSAEGSETVLKARLQASPAHPRALQWLLEAVALWQGTQVHAVVCAERTDRSCATHFYQDWFTDFGAALYTLRMHEGRRQRRAHRDAIALGSDFRDLRQLTFELAGER